MDVLVLAGLEDSVNQDNAGTVKAGHVVEMANGPVTKWAYDSLSKDGHVIIPDIIANAGGVTVSYLEWVQNIENQRWTEDEVNAKLETYIKDAVRAMYEYATEHHTSLKEAAFDVALQRLEA